MEIIKEEDKENNEYYRSYALMVNFYTRFSPGEDMMTYDVFVARQEKLKWENENYDDPIDFALGSVGDKEDKHYQLYCLEIEYGKLLKKDYIPRFQKYIKLLKEKNKTIEDRQNEVIAGIARQKQIIEDNKIQFSAETARYLQDRLQELSKTKMFDAVIVFKQANKFCSVLMKKGKDQGEIARTVVRLVANNVWDRNYQSIIKEYEKS